MINQYKSIAENIWKNHLDKLNFALILLIGLSMIFQNCSVSHIRFSSNDNVGSHSADVNENSGADTSNSKPSAVPVNIRISDLIKNGFKPAKNQILSVNGKKMNSSADGISEAIQYDLNRGPLEVIFKTESGSTKTIKISK